MVHIPVDSRLRQDFYIYHSSVFTPDSPYPLHDHDFCEFFIVFSGRLKHILNGKTAILEPGTICFIRPSDRHELHWAPGAPATELLNCNVLPDELKRLLRFIAGETPVSLDDCVLTIPPSRGLRRQALLREAEEIFCSKPGMLKKARLRVLLADILILLLRSSGCTSDSAPEWLREARLAMHRPENYRAGLKRFIELSDRTQEHLCRAMRRYYSETPQQCLNAIRLEAVYDRIIRHGGNISTAAFEAGFHNLSGFRRAFQQRYGVSPKTLKKKI